jgi:hypothetical protein
MWRYAVGRGDEDPARAEFVEQVEARLRTESSQERRRQAARKATEALRAKLRAAGIDPHTYYSMLAQRGNAARWHKQDAAPPQASQAGACVTECAPAPQASEAAPQASQAPARVKQAEAAPAEVGAEAGQARRLPRPPRRQKARCGGLGRCRSTCSEAKARSAGARKGA